MIDEHDVTEMLRRRAQAVPATPADASKVVRRAHRRLAVTGVVGTVAAVAIAMSAFAGLEGIRSARVPAERPPADLGIFAPISGRILYVNEHEMGDVGYDPGLWTVDPSGPADTVAGPAVDGDVATSLVRLDLEDAIPIGWSADGTKLLFKRSSDDLFPEEYLFVLDSDGTETRLHDDPMLFGGATISPDGSRVVFAESGDLYAVDADGGRPVRLRVPIEGIAGDPTFSPDGTRIAYVDFVGSGAHLWVADVDGGIAREILTDEGALPRGAGEPQWSPAGDRLAISSRMSNGDNVVFTVAPDGSNLRQVFVGALSPHWSPDGSRIAYTIECDLSDTSCGGLAIADADGSNVLELGYAASGPWHPGDAR